MSDVQSWETKCRPMVRRNIRSHPIHHPSPLFNAASCQHQTLFLSLNTQRQLDCIIDADGYGDSRHRPQARPPMADGQQSMIGTRYLGIQLSVARYLMPVSTLYTPGTPPSKQMGLGTVTSCCSVGSGLPSPHFTARTDQARSNGSLVKPRVPLASPIHLRGALTKRE